MTPVYVIYFILFIYLFIFLHSFPSETSPEHFNRVFSTCAVRKTKTLGTEWMLVVDWLIFGHGVFPAVKSNRVENTPCDVTREILLNIIHTHQIKQEIAANCEKYIRAKDTQVSLMILSSEFKLVKPFVFLSFIFESTDRYNVFHMTHT